jgi:capsule polysaccharide export protein KpsC/LpsZ
LVAACLLLYPRYWDPRSGGFVEIETILDRIVEARAALPKAHEGALRSTLRRQARRWSALGRGLWAAYRLTG